MILSGLRMGFTIALLAIIGSEVIASLAGLGHHIVQLAEGMDMARMFAYIAFVVVIAAPAQRRRLVPRSPRQAQDMNATASRISCCGMPAWSGSASSCCS